MLKLIAGKKGSGKTKQLISMVNDAAGTTNGKVVCIEKGSKLTYDISHDVRLFNTDDYDVCGYEAFYGFIAGIAASDYDVKDIFVDAVLKITGEEDDKFAEFLKKVDAVSEKAEIKVVMALSRDIKELPEEISKYVFINLV